MVEERAVRPNEKDFLGKTSYSYAEVLCGSIAVKPAQPAKKPPAPETTP